MAKRRSSGGRHRATKWSGVYERNGQYYPRLYLGKVDGKSQYEWLDPHRTGQAAADALAAERTRRAAARAPRERHTIASWGAATDEHEHGLWLSLRPRPKRSTHINYAAQIQPFVRKYGDMPLVDVDVELALEWIEILDKGWTLGGLRAMFTDARRAGLVPVNPFVGLGQSRGHGRKHIDVLTVAQVLDLAEAARRTWGDAWAAFVLWQAFVGTRPGEAYGLIRADIDFAAGEVDIRRQRTPYDTATPLAELPIPKNGRTRRVTVLPPALDAMRALPTPLKPHTAIWLSNKGRPVCGANQHYYWHPIRSAFGDPKLDLYELRHFCGSYLLNTLGLPAQDVADQLGHTDGGVLVMRLYGHPDSKLARKRIVAAYSAASVTDLGQKRSNGVTKESHTS